jgi:TatD DNase family protein
LLETQLVIARDADLPVVLHVLKAHDDVLVLLKRVKVKGGFTHAFNGSVQQAQHYRDLGFCVGFGGMLTFERSTKLRHLVATLPMDMIVLETDAPDMTVSQHRGERNSPAYLPYCLEAMARVRDIDPQEIARITTTNARRVLNLGVTNVEGK